MKQFIRSMLPPHWAREIRHLKNYRALRGRQLAKSASRIAASAGGPKVVYALTPPPSLSNIGDHAQVVAIRRWIDRWLPGKPVLEVDKDDCTYCVPELELAIGADDVILLHSGGNLGDRGARSERARRNVIRAFPGNPVVSLPQTIFFSDTPDGRRQKQITRRVYARHPNLTVLGRDHRSGELAAEMFPGATTFATPDFVLSLPPKTAPESAGRPRRTLVCLRNDDESDLSAPQRAALKESIGGELEEFDTTIAEPIVEDRRGPVLDETLDYFASFDAVVTDRYHGLIFSVLCRRPTVVLGTVDHKLVSAFDWFSGIRGLRFADSVDKVPGLLAETLAEGFSGAPDWNAEYFDPLGERVRGVAAAHAPGVWG